MGIDKQMRMINQAHQTFTLVSSGGFVDPSKVLYFHVTTDQFNISHQDVQIMHQINQFHINLPDQSKAFQQNQNSVFL